MVPNIADFSTILDRILNTAADNFRIAKILVQMGLDPNNITYDALFNRMLEIVLANITLANMFALVGAIFFVATLLMQTMVPLRVANMVGCSFFAISGALSGSVATFLLYLLLLPVNAVRLRQLLKLIKKARNATQGLKNRHFDFGGDDVALRTLQLGSNGKGIHFRSPSFLSLDTRALFQDRVARCVWDFSLRSRSKNYRVFRPRQWASLTRR
jgi:hypothetical protein